MSDIDNQLLSSLKGLTDAVNNQSQDIREQGKIVNDMQVELANMRGKLEGLEDRVQDAKDFRHEIRDMLNQRLGTTDTKVIRMENKHAELEKSQNEMKTDMATRKGKDSILSLIWSGLVALGISVASVLFGRQ